MELLVDLALAPIVGFVLAQIIKRLPAKIQLFLGSLIIAFVATIIAWIIFVSLFKPSFAENLGQTLLGLQILFVITLVLVFFGINHVQSRRIRQYNQEQFAVISDLIRGYQFHKALDLLKQMNHPQAREWETIVTNMIHQDPDFLQHLESR